MEDLRTLASEARRFLQPHWAEWHVAWGPLTPSLPSEWTCLRSSIFVQRVLAQAGISAELASGVPDRDGTEPFGFFSRGVWQSHAWLRASSTIIDVTADQFGADEVIISTLADPRYSEGATSDRTLRMTSPQAAAVEAIWPAWCVSRG